MEELKRRLYSMKDEIRNRDNRGLIANSIYVKGYINAIDDVLEEIENSELQCIAENIFGELRRE